MTHPRTTPTAALILASLTCPGVEATEPSFGDPAHHPIGTFPVGITVSDLTGDGAPEVIVANGQSPGVSVLPNLGRVFGPETRHDIGGGRPREVAAADLDGDGDKDLVVAVRDGPGAIAVLLNEGAGTFGPATQYGPPLAAFTLALVDLDEDGDCDAAVLAPSAFGADVVVLRNRGDGTFTSAVAHHAIDSDIVYAADLAAADVNGDDRPDLVVTSDCPSSCGERTVVLLGDAAGGLTAPVPFDVGLFQPTGVVAADLNADGAADLAVMDCRFGDQTLVIAMNDGAGGFAEVGRHAVTQVCHTFTTPAAIAVGDVNLDGAPDIVLTVHRDNRVLVFTNRGDATFEPAAAFATDQEPMAVTIADVDADGRADVVTANLADIGTPGTASVLLNRSTAADLDGSGAVDFGDILAVLSAWGNKGGPEDLDESGVVDFGDLLIVLAAWGPCE